MTYCVAMLLNRGLVFAADTRTNAGVDNIAQFRKVHSWCKPGERVLVLLTAGNLSLTQSVISLLQRAARRARRRARRRQPLRRALDVPRRPSRRGCRAQHPGDRRRGAGSDEDGLVRFVHLQATRSAPSGRVFSRSTRKATSSRRPTRRPTSRSASTSTVSRSSTAWRGRRAAWRRLRKLILSASIPPCAPTCRSACRSTSFCMRPTVSSCAAKNSIFQDDEYFKKLSLPRRKRCARTFTKIEELNL